MTRQVLMAPPLLEQQGAELTQFAECLTERSPTPSTVWALIWVGGAEQPRTAPSSWLHPHPPCPPEPLSPEEDASDL